MVIMHLVICSMLPPEFAVIAEESYDVLAKGLKISLSVWNVPAGEELGANDPACTFCRIKTTAEADITTTNKRLTQRRTSIDCIYLVYHIY